MTRREIRKRCHETGKHSYRDEEAARWAGRRVLKLNAAYAEARYRLRPDMWVYRCKWCGWWHLTSQRPRTGTDKIITLEDEDQ